MTRIQPTDSSGDETKFADKQQSLENLLFVAYGSRTRATERQLPGLMAIKTTTNLLIYYRRSRLCRPYTNYRFCQFIERSKLIPLFPVSYLFSVSFAIATRFNTSGFIFILRPPRARLIVSKIIMK